MISTISNWKNDLKTPSRRQPVRLASGTVFCPLLWLYDAHLKACNVLDFDDLIYCRRYSQRNEEVRELQNKIRYLLVDEYQDTNTASMNW
ncbi:UvrD-helicase domain-containing protein [Shigella flexneri]|uniref:UvrD-helicase domain-containing protein n=1 Tax=Shigella flexneri TaxID=623 RepID=UPI0020CC790E|nr:UvrD-helicase domain-containing protein [Shigella flexneri]